MPAPKVLNMDEILSVDEPARTMRKNLISMAMAGIEAVMPENLIPSVLARKGDALTVNGNNGPLSFDLSSYDRIHLAGAGKASAEMGKAVAGIIGDLTEGGHINGIEDGEIPVGGGKVSLKRAGHPVPDENSIEGSRKILDIFSSSGKKDLIIFLLSGGASAMLSLPAEGIEKEKLAELTNALLKSGASIQEINCVRRHISQVKGGRLAAMTEATVLTLIISDVVGNQLESIGSGPTAADPTTYADARAVMKKYGLDGRFPSVMEALDPRNETVKPGDLKMKRVHNIIIADNRTAVKAMEKVAEERKCRFTAFYDITGDVDAVSKKLAGECNPPGLCLGGGEMTVEVSGSGKGGRCQEFVLRLFPNGYRGIALAIGSDGLDGNSGAAGGVFDNAAMKMAVEMGLSLEEFLKESDSYSLLSRLKTAISTGPTGTNVGDLYVMLPFGKSDAEKSP